MVKTWSLWGMGRFKVIRGGGHLWIDMLLFLDNVTTLLKPCERQMPRASRSVQEFHVHKLNYM